MITENTGNEQQKRDDKAIGFMVFCAVVIIMAVIGSYFYYSNTVTIEYRITGQDLYGSCNFYVPIFLTFGTMEKEIFIPKKEHRLDLKENNSNSITIKRRVKRPFHARISGNFMSAKLEIFVNGELQREEDEEYRSFSGISLYIMGYENYIERKY